MKLDARRVPGFLRDPGPCRAVLLHGEDEGMIRERAASLVRAVVGDASDPFRIAELGRDGFDAIPAEMAALSLSGGRRVVRVREVTEAAHENVRRALAGPGQALLVLEAPGLGKGRLRTLVEAAPDAVAIGCYQAEGRALEAAIRQGLEEHGVHATAEALALLAQALAGDHGVMRAELEKLVLYAGLGGTVDAEAVVECVAGAGSASLDEAVRAALCGRAAEADRSLEAALAEGVTGIAVLRTALAQLQRLHQAGLRVRDGMTAEAALAALRPPLFFKAREATATALRRWPPELSLRALGELRLVEIACKSTGSRPELLARRFVAALARQGVREGTRRPVSPG